MNTKREQVLHKIMDFPEIVRQAKIWKLKNNKIVFTNGCFDLLHPGHIELLLAAATFGNKLIIGLNSDHPVKKLKGKNRPIFSENDRALLLASQLFIDAVVVFNEETPLSLIELIKPDVLIKGGDYQINDIVGADFVKSHEGEVHTIPFVPGYSTTSIIEKLQQKKMD